MDFTEKTLRRINGYEGIIVRVNVDRIQLADGREALREVVEHPGGVCVLPIDGEGRAWCVRQFRYPARRHFLEAPAGKLEPGEEPRSAALRELREETGFIPGRLLELGEFHTSPGYNTEKLHLFLALELTRGEAQPDPGELLELVPLPFAELTDMVMRNELPDAKTAMAVLKADRLLSAGLARGERSSAPD